MRRFLSKVLVVLAIGFLPACSSTLDKAREAEKGGKTDEARKLFQAAATEAQAAGDPKVLDEAQVAGIRFEMAELDKAQPAGHEAAMPIYRWAVTHEATIPEADPWIARHVPEIAVCDGMSAADGWSKMYTAYSACFKIKQWTCAVDACQKDDPPSRYLPIGARALANIESSVAVMEKLVPHTGVGHPYENLAEYLSKQWDAEVVGHNETLPWPPDGGNRTVSSTVFKVRTGSGPNFMVTTDTANNSVIGLQAVLTSLPGESNEAKISSFIENYIPDSRPDSRQAAVAWATTDHDAFSTLMTRGSAVKMFDASKWGLNLGMTSKGSITVMLIAAPTSSAVPNTCESVCPRAEQCAEDAYPNVHLTALQHQGGIDNCVSNCNRDALPQADLDCWATTPCSKLVDVAGHLPKGGCKP